jgi:transposase-like protein
MSKVVSLTRSDFAENFLWLNGRNLSLSYYPHLRKIYNTEAREVVLMFSRQTAKSTTLANIMITNSAMIPGFRTLYVSPTVNQTKIFSHDRVTPVIMSSPFIKKYFINSSLVQNVFMKQFLNRSKMDLQYALLSGDRLRGYSADMNLFDECYSDNIEVLTDSGWKLFSNLTKSELLATRDNSGNLEYQLPSRYIEKDYNGEILDFTHRSFKLSVTPQHNLYISQELNTGYYKDPKIKGWQLKKAEDFKDKNFKMTSVAKYHGINSETITIPGFSVKTKPDGTMYQKGKIRVYPDIKFSTKEFMIFMGWWLSEGHVSNCSNQIIISQNEGALAAEIRDCLSVLIGNYSESVDNGGHIKFSFSNATLRNYLLQFGGSHDKFIPKDLLNQTNYLELLLEALYKGDAMRHKNDISSWGELNTASKRLADTVQIAWLFLGRRATIRQITESNGTVMYRVRPLLLDYQIFWNSSNRVSSRNYHGKVYCATVPNGNLIVRDSIEKTAVVCGNCQDLRAEIIPVVQETMSRSMYKKSAYSGTPKRTQGTLASLWRRSTMNEYVIKCPPCGHWNILDENNIGESGVICKKCGRPLSVQNGQWVSTYSRIESPNAEGYRVCLLHFAHAPWVDWTRDVLEKRKNFSRSYFHNEVLAIEYDEGASPVTKTDIRACCSDRPMASDPDELAKSYSTVVGIDYGPINSEASHTLLTVVQMRADVAYVLYCKRFVGKEADYSFIHKEVPRIMGHWGSNHLAADYGMGEASNSEIRSRIGFEKVIAFQHLQTQKEKIRWNAKMPAYTLNRNQVLGEFFDRIKKRKIVFPRWEDFETFSRDIMNVQLEFDEERNTMKYINIGPDDLVHSLVYALISLELFYGIGQSF